MRSPRPTRRAESAWPEEWDYVGSLFLIGDAIEPAVLAFARSYACDHCGDAGR